MRAGSDDGEGAGAAPLISGGRRAVAKCSWLSSRTCRAVCLFVCVAASWRQAAAMSESTPATQPSQQDTHPRKTVIFGTDDRRLVSNTTTFPWSAIGQVQLHFGYEMYVGTAAMIGRYLALTCGHVAADTSLGTPDSIEFIPGQTSQSQPYGRVKVVQVIPSPQWKAYKDDGYDIAILVLDQPIGDQTGYFKIAVQPDGFFDNQSVESAGYPTDLGGLDMYTVSSVTAGMDGNVIYHYLDTEPGQSGSPVWYGDAAKGEERLVGLNEGSYLTATPVGTIQRGIAARIDQSVANWIDDLLIANNDVPQNISVGGGSSTQTSSSGTGLCGAGIGPFVLLSMAGWGACLVSQRKRQWRVARGE